MQAIIIATVSLSVLIIGIQHCLHWAIRKIFVSYGHDLNKAWTIAATASVIALLITIESFQAIININKNGCV